VKSKKKDDGNDGEEGGTRLGLNTVLFAKRVFLPFFFIYFVFKYKNVF